MKIVFLFDSTYPYYTGGIETWVYNVCERMIKSHEITIVNVKNYRIDDRMGHFENINKNINFISVSNLNHVPVIRKFVRSYVAVYNCNITAYSMVKKLRKYLLPEEKYYVISLGTVFAAKAARIIKKEFPNIVSIVSSRSLHPEVLGETYPGTKNIALRMEKKNLLAADMIWSNGLDTQAALAKKGFTSLVIRNGVDIKRLDAITPFDMKELGIENKIKIVTIGTVQKIEGYYEIIDALAVLKEKHGLEVHLVGVGKGKIEIFEKYAKIHNVKEQVHFTGEKRNVISYAKAADIVVCLSGGSGFGMAALESMLSKTPIIAWDSPVYRQMIENRKSGLLIKAWDANALAQGILEVWNNIENCKYWGENAYKSVQRFDWKYVVEDIESAMEQL